MCQRHAIEHYELIRILLMRKQEALVVRNYRIFLIILYVFPNKKKCDNV